LGIEKGYLCRGNKSGRGSWVIKAGLCSKCHSVHHLDCFQWIPKMGEMYKTVKVHQFAIYNMNMLMDKLHIGKIHVPSKMGQQNKSALYNE
jgi:hypothetical protein